MAVRLGDDAPNFTADTTEGEHRLLRLEGRQLGGAVLAPEGLHPGLHHRAGHGRQAQARVRQAQRQGHRPVSVDPLDSHGEWGKDIEETQGTALNFPLIADPDRKVADLYDMIHPNANDTMTVRSVFVIGPDNKVKLTLTYPASTGPQLRRDPPGHRLAAAHRQAQGRHAGQLEARRGRHHRAGRLRRGGQGEVRRASPPSSPTSARCPSRK